MVNRRVRLLKANIAAVVDVSYDYIGGIDDRSDFPWDEWLQHVQTAGDNVTALRVT